MDQDMDQGLTLLDEGGEVLIDGGHFLFGQGDAASGFFEDEWLLFLGYSGELLLNYS